MRTPFFGCLKLLPPGRSNKHRYSFLFIKPLAGILSHFEQLPVIGFHSHLHESDFFISSPNWNKPQKVHISERYTVCKKTLNQSISARQMVLGMHTKRRKGKTKTCYSKCKCIDLRWHFGGLCQVYGIILRLQRKFF